MKILFDSTIFLSQRAAGVSRYYYELYRGVRDQGYNPKVAGMFTKNKYTLADPILKKKMIRDPFALFTAINRYQISKAIKGADSNTIYHPSNLRRQYLDILSNDAKLVITIHDMIVEREDNRIDELKRDFAMRADKIIAISQATKDEIIDILNIPHEKIDVIYHGSSIDVEKAVKPKNVLPAKYLLYVGGHRKHKNLPFMFESLAPILRQRADLYFVCAGYTDFADEDLIQFEKLGIKDKIISVVKPEDDELAYIYANSYAFIFPSFYEGFGIPILEAWSCNTPTVLSDNTCFREIADSAALFFDPHSKESLATTIESILDNEKLREELIEKGKQRLKMFSWEKASKQVIDVYKSVFQEK